MSRWGSSNNGLLFLSFLMAVGIVWMKGQDTLASRTLSGIPVSINRLPPNLVLPDSWVEPTVTATLDGPKSVVDIIRAPQCGFLIPFPDTLLSERDNPQNVILTKDMFRTSMVDENDRIRISVDEKSLHPRQVSFYIFPWNVDRKKPSVKDLPTSRDSVAIPLFRLEKQVPIVAPTIGNSPQGVHITTHVDPPTLLLTGPREAIDQIRSVSTAFLDISLANSQTPPQYMTLPDIKEKFGAWPVEQTVQGVTVTLKFKK